ncbi:DUF2849 domain-containing protein [Novacetimonas cocois]|uniref:DUF2849 domain-containing protein n=1 Tax=Novacetimonas cocois TaxID=1747507 RepID=A0A365YTJ5_9PROT|nr:DUF2849 domain-containing protein [Novacetimonas cocois]RBM05279.1 DUF2849 domain-containing protein [Novacetimonas cocois]
MDVRNNRRTTTGSSVVTANRLLDGRIVWLTDQGTWSGNIAHAAVWPNDHIESVIADTARHQQEQGVVGVYGVQLDDRAAGICPLTVRERIRAFGPTVHPQFAPGAPQEDIAHV